MTIMRRIMNILLGLLTIACALLIFLLPGIGLYLALAIFTFYSLLYSIRTIVYYIRLARHMVGGQIILYIGIFTLCCSVYAMKIQTAPRTVISLILVIILLGIGVIDLLRAREARQGGAGSWKFSMTTAVLEIVLAVVCLVFNAADSEVTGIVFAIALVYSGVSRIISSLRKANWHRIAGNFMDVT